MTRVLASVTSAAEALTAMEAGADIIDLKDPTRGALGALDRTEVGACVARIGGRRPVSTTIGDLPMMPLVLGAAVVAAAATGVDIVKVGFFPDGDHEACIRAVVASRGPCRVVGVILADRLTPSLPLIDRMAAAGFAGVMLDTATKDGRTLRDHVDDATLDLFIARAARRGIWSGLAGSLGVADVAPLARLGPDILGFRGALCRNGMRSTALDPTAAAAVIAAVRAAVSSPPPAAQGAATTTGDPASSRPQ